MYRTILVGTDGSLTSRAALQHALDLAEASEATVHVLTVVDSTRSPFQFGVDDVADIDNAAAQLVNDIVDEFNDRNVDIEAEVLRGSPVSSLIDYAEEIDADEIIVGRAGRGTTIEELLGNTALQLLRRTERPVTVVS